MENAYMTVNDRKTLYSIAQEANMKVPYEWRQESWDLFPNFELFVALHRHTVAPNKDVMLANAKLIATIDSDEADRITKSKLIKMGFIDSHHNNGDKQ